MQARPYDVVLYGASGFSGRQATIYLRDHAPPELRWAIAGRNQVKLHNLRRQLGLSASVGTLIADSREKASVDEMVGATRALASTAGPFAKYGDPVVEACVEQGTHYADITGETPWVRSLIERFHERAAAEGTRIVPCCGFDSVPSDLGTLLLTDWISATWGCGTLRVQSAFKVGRAGFNGGTIASALNMADRIGELRDVLLLNPPGARGEAERRRSQDRQGWSWDEDLRCWLAPFVMAPINTRVVRRSNALLAAAELGYGQDFAYAEALEAPSRRQAALITLADRAAGVALGFGPLRGIAQRLAPPPGTGPSEELMRKGWFQVRLVGEAENGRKALCRVRGDGDPANRATVRMLCESAICLALEQDALPQRVGKGGVLTPATALGQTLASRLRAAGMELEVTAL